MPKLWESTVEGHRDAVRASIARATAELAQRHGITGLTMSAIAREAGLSRATLYRYASDTAEAVDLWRIHQIDEHLQQLQTVAERTSPQHRLNAVLERYATSLQHGHGDAGLPTPHHGSAVTEARSTVSTLLGELISAGAVRGEVRTDLPVEELLLFAMTSLEAAAQLSSRQAALRLAQLVAESLQPREEAPAQAGENMNGVP